MVPAYYRSRRGRMFRVQRLAERLGEDGERYVLRGTAVRIGAEAQRAEVARDVRADGIRERIGRGMVVPTPEETYEQLWQQLRVDLEAL